MELAVCQDKIKVESTEDGFCQDDQRPDQKTDPNVDKCIPKDCPNDDDPICGSDNFTYKNQCILDKTNCDQGLNITIKTKGYCEEIKTKKEDCVSICSRIFSPVCGSDGKTYNNECLLKTATCQNPQVKLSYAGPCDRKKFDDAGMSIRYFYMQLKS